MTKIGQNSLYWVVRYGVHKVFWLLPAMTLTFDFLTPKSNQHIYKCKYIHDQHWVKLLSLVWEIRCCDLDLWPFDLIGMSQAQVHISPNFGEISSNNYEYIVFTLWPWTLIPKANKHIYETKYICDQNWAKFSLLDFEISFFTRYLQGFGLLAAVTLTFEFLTPKSNQHIYKCKYICDQNWVKLPSLV